MLQITPSRLQGSLSIPPSKSHTLRAILFAALAKGTSSIENYLSSPDTNAMIAAVQALGAKVEIFPTELRIQGGDLSTPTNIIDCGNSGLVLRLVGAIASLFPHYTILTGDDSIRKNRPAKPLLNGLTQLGAIAHSALGNGKAPLLIKGPLTGSSAYIDGQDSQPVSGLLIAAAFAPHPIEIHVENPGEKPWIDLTLYWLKKCGITVERDGYHLFRLRGNATIAPFHYRVPADFSTAAFPIAAALLTHSFLTLENIDMSDVQGDKKLISILQNMGAQITISQNKVEIFPSSLQGACIDMNDCIDALPILSVIGCFASGETTLCNAAIARNKESDRISSIAKELRKMGALIEEHSDGLTIKSAELHGGHLETHQDHRIGLSLSVAALAAKGSSTIEQTECIAKTYPDFRTAFQKLGALIE